MRRNRNANTIERDPAARMRQGVNRLPVDVSTTPRLRSYDGIYRQAFRFAPWNLDRLTQTQGYELADEMLTLGACYSPFNLKRMAIQSDGYEIQSAIADPNDTRFEEAKEYADFVAWVLGHMCSPSGYPQEMPTAICEISRGIWDGFRVGELLWTYLEEGPYTGNLGLEGISWKHAKQIGFDYDPITQQPLTLTSYTPGGAAVTASPYATRPTRVDVTATKGGYDFEVPVEKCVIFTYLPDAGIINTPGDWRPSYKHFYRIDNNLRFWARALKRWGSPVIIGKAQSNNQEQINTAVDYFNKIEDGQASVIPDNLPYELVEAHPQIFDGYLKACQYDEAMIAKVVLGSTLTTGEGEHGSTSAGAEQHGDVNQTVYGYCRQRIEGAFNAQVIDRICRNNLRRYDQALCPQLDLRGDRTENILQMMRAFDLAIGDGLVWKGETWMRDRLGWNPLTPEDAAAWEAEQQQQEVQRQEAAQRLADARNSGAVGPLNDGQTTRALAKLQQAIRARDYVETRWRNPLSDQAAA